MMRVRANQRGRGVAPAAAAVEDAPGESVSEMEERRGRLPIPPSGVSPSLTETLK